VEPAELPEIAVDRGVQGDPPKKNPKIFEQIFLIIPLSFSGCSSDLVHEILQQ